MSKNPLLEKGHSQKTTGRERACRRSQNGSIDADEREGEGEGWRGREKEERVGEGGRRRRERGLVLSSLL